MIEHLVLFKWKADTSASDKTKALTGLRSLKELVPGVVDLTAGENFSARAQGFDSGLVVRFRDKAALDVYAVHPEHLKVVDTLIKPRVESVLALDYEF